MSSLVVGSTLNEFFKNLLGDAIARQRISLAEVTEFYLVNLLSEFVTSEKLFSEELGGRKDHEPLAVLYHRAHQQQREERIRTLRRLGDVSLYKAGFFAESVRGSVVGPDYYISMGGNAYGQVACLAPSSSYAFVYRELQEKFRALVEVLEEIAARGMAASGPQGVVQVLENWTRNKSGRLEQVLIDSGVLPPKGSIPN